MCMCVCVYMFVYVCVCVCVYSLQQLEQELNLVTSEFE